MKLPYISSPAEIPNEEYHTADQYKEYVSSSVLKNIITSPLWMKYCQEHPEDIDPTKQWKLAGGCYHDILSSVANTGDMTEFEENTAIFDPPVNPKTGQPYGYTTAKFIDAYEMTIADNPGKAIYSRTEYDNSMAMVKALRHENLHLSGIVNNLLKIGKAEISIFIEHKPNDLVQFEGGLLKVRKDLTTRNKIIDWKTVSRKNGGEAPLKPDQFAGVIADRGYGFSAAMYQYVEWVVTGKWKPFYWVVQENEPPYDANIISAEHWAFAIDGGQMVGAGTHAEMFLRALEQYFYCIETNTWPGVSIFTKPDYRNHRVAVSKVPGYVAAKDFDFYN